MHFFKISLQTFFLIHGLFRSVLLSDWQLSFHFSLTRFYFDSTTYRDCNQVRCHRITGKPECLPRGMNVQADFSWHQKFVFRLYETTHLETNYLISELQVKCKLMKRLFDLLKSCQFVEDYAYYYVSSLIQSSNFPIIEMSKYIQTQCQVKNISQNLKVLS